MLKVPSAAKTALISARAIRSKLCQHEHRAVAEHISPQCSHRHGGHFPQCEEG
jgi:hypothetical protein